MAGRTRKTLITSALAAAVMMGSAPVSAGAAASPSTAPPAPAGVSAAEAETIGEDLSFGVMGTCTAGVVCGDVLNSVRSTQPLFVTCNFGNKWPEAVTVRPGNRAPCKDDDGFYAEPGFKTTYVYDGYPGAVYTAKPGTWVKVNNVQTTAVTVTR